jgi:hypothetical protein
MTPCYKLKKDECRKDCTWVSGKGCTKTVGAVAGGKLTGQTIVFMGFTNDTFKDQIVKVGGVVRSAVSGKTTIVVYKETPRNAKTIADCSVPIKLTIEAFTKKYMGGAGPVVIATEPNRPVGWRARFEKDSTHNNLNYLVKSPNANGKGSVMRKVPLKTIYTQAYAIAESMFKTAKVRSFNKIVYVPKGDKFIMIVRVGSKKTAAVKNNLLNDFLGIEFTFGGKIVMSSNAHVLLSDHKGEFHSGKQYEVLQANFPGYIEIAYNKTSGF